MTDKCIFVPMFPHEQDAMQQLVLAARDIASTLPPLEVQAVKLRVWAQIVEDVLERIEQREQAQ